MRAIADEVEERSDAYEENNEPRRPVYDQEAQEAEPESAAPVQAGGLRAPDAFEIDESKSQIEKDLEKADREDSDRGLEWAYVSADIGVQWLNFEAPTGRVKQSSLSLSATAGVRLLYFTLGARFASNQAKQYYSYSTTTELGFKMPIGSFEPHLLLGVGYTRVAKMTDSLLGVTVESVEQPRMDGMNLRTGAGFDYFLSPTFSVGTLLSADWVRFFRMPEQGGEALGEPSSGAQIRATFVLALHI